MFVACPVWHAFFFHKLLQDPIFSLSDHIDTCWAELLVLTCAH